MKKSLNVKKKLKNHGQGKLFENIAKKKLTKNLEKIIDKKNEKNILNEWSTNLDAIS